MLDSISYVNCHKKLYNNMNLYFCSDLGCQKLVKSMAKSLHKDLYLYKLYSDGPGIHIKRQLLGFAMAQICCNSGGMYNVIKVKFCDCRIQLQQH